MGGRLVASRLSAGVSAWYVVWSRSKWTVTLAYPATAWRTSRRFFSAAARAMARVLRAVAGRVARSAGAGGGPRGGVVFFRWGRGGGGAALACALTRRA